MEQPALPDNQPSHPDENNENNAEATGSNLPPNENLDMLLVTRIIRHLVDNDDPTKACQKAYN